MKEQFDRYFELLPVLLIALILAAGEARKAQVSPVPFDRANFEWRSAQPLPPHFGNSPRLIFR